MLRMLNGVGPTRKPNFWWIHVFLAFVCLAANPLAAETPKMEGHQAGNESTLFIPFSPPLNTELRFRLTKETIGGEKEKKTELDCILVFAQKGDGYLMTVEYRVPVNPKAKIKGAQTAAVIGPVVFRLNEVAEIAEVLDEDEYWESTLALIKLARPKDHAYAERAILDMRRKPDADRFDLIAANILPIINLAYTEHVPGKVDSETYQTKAVVGDRDVTSSSTSKLTVVSDRLAKYEVRTVTSGGQIKAAVTGAVESVGDTQGDKEKSRKSIEKIGKMSFDDLVGTETYQVSFDTGLAEKFESRQVVVVSDETEKATVTKIVRLQKIE